MAWHAKKSASGSKQWIKCPGSLAFVEGLPASMRRPTGQAAMLGTCAHGLAEYALTSGFRTLENIWLDTVIWLDADEDALIIHDDVPKSIETPAQLSAHLGKDVKFFTRVDQMMLEGVQLYLDVCWEAMDQMGDGTEMVIEKRLSMDWLRPGLGGTADCVLFQFLGLLRVIDYKNGYVAVEADDNTQALTYALATAQEMEWAFEEVEVVIVQPNSMGQKVKRWGITIDELRAFQERLAEASDLVDEAFESYAQLTDEVDFIEWSGTYLSVGEDGSHCTFCDGYATCPAAKAKAEELAIADFADSPPDGNPLEVHDEGSLTRLTNLIKWGKFLDNLVKAANTLGQRRLEQGLEVPGHKLVRGKANRAWPGEAEVVKTMVEAGFDPDDLYEPPKPPALKSPAQMEKLGEPRSKQRKLAKEKVEDLAIKPDGKLTMAPIDDPREAIVPQAGAADDFVDDVEWTGGEG